MRFCSACLPLFFLPLAFGQGSPVPPAAGPPTAAQGPGTQPVSGKAVDPFRDEALVYEHLDSTIRMETDGTGESVKHVVVRIQSEGAARQFGVLSVSFASASTTGTIENVRVHKPDGAVVVTPVADMQEQPAAITREAPLYSDIREKQLPVRSLSAGDTLEYDLHTVQTKSETPGNFWGAMQLFFPDTVILSETVTLVVPAAKYVNVWCPKHKAEMTEAGGRRTYRWTGSQLNPTPKPSENGASEPVPNPDEDADGHPLPAVAWSTFHSWAEVGDWYRTLSLSRAQPTEAIRARAEELTRDVKVPEDQVRALYNFVSARTRYIGIDLGIGRYQPHAAAEVLSNQYGDCKDKDTLLEALLRAKGFVTSPALIGVGLFPVPELPSPASFNHVITTVKLPSGRIWLDSTPEVAPFRILLPQLRDQQALVIPTSGPATLEKTPKDPPYPYRERFEADATLDSSGLLKGKVTFTLRSDNELGYRVLLQRASPSQWDSATQLVSNEMGFTGTVTHADLHQPDAEGPVQIRYDYSRPSYADWQNLKILPLFPSLEITSIDADKAPERDIDLGTPRTLEAVTRVHLPEGFSATLPDPVHVKRDYTTFDKTYRMEGDEKAGGSTLIVERKVTVTQPKLPKAQWKEYVSFSKATGLSAGENYIQLSRRAASPTASEEGAGELGVNPHLAQSKVSPRELMSLAETQERTADWQAENSTLEKLRQQEPTYPYLYSMLGYLAGQTGRHQEAISNYETELKNHPDARPWIAVLLAWEYEYDHRGSEGIALLKTYSAKKDRDVALNLANLQYRHEDYAGTILTLNTALKAYPGDPSMLLQLAPALHMLKRDEEASTAIHTAIKDATSPSTLNEGAYQLGSLLRSDLPFAEQCARKAVKLLETASTERTLAETNSSAYEQSNTLLASWDTLGWILVLEHSAGDMASTEDIVAAEEMLTASWMGTLNPEVGGHLAHLYERTKRRSVALRQYHLASAALEKSTGPPIRDFIRASIDRLADYEEVPETPAEEHRQSSVLHQSSLTREKASGRDKELFVPEKADSAALLRLRTYHIARPGDVSGWGVFRFQVSHDAILAVQQASGSPSLRTMIPALSTLKFPDLVPAHSKAHLLRSGVLTCSRDPCELVLMLKPNLAQEQVE